MGGRLEPILLSAKSETDMHVGDCAEMAVDPKNLDKSNSKGTVYTIGHAMASLHNFLELLHDSGINILIDVRSFPERRRKRYFRKTELQATCEKYNVQ